MNNYINLKWLRNYIYVNTNIFTNDEDRIFILKKLDNILKEMK